MILPFITAFSRDVLLMVPRVTKEAGYGMGSTTWEVLRKISLRYALSGVVGATFIGLGPRARRDHGGRLPRRR